MNVSAPLVGAVADWQRVQGVPCFLSYGPGIGCQSELDEQIKIKVIIKVLFFSTSFDIYMAEMSHNITVFKNDFTQKLSKCTKKATVLTVRQIIKDTQQIISYSQERADYSNDETTAM